MFICLISSSLPAVKKKIVVGHMWVKESMVGGLPWWVE
jgi:hypothetical protein